MKCWVLSEQKAHLPKVGVFVLEIVWSLWCDNSGTTYSESIHLVKGYGNSVFLLTLFAPLPIQQWALARTGNTSFGILLEIPFLQESGYMAIFYRHPEYGRQRTSTPVDSPTPHPWKIIIFPVSDTKSLSSQSLTGRGEGTVGLEEHLTRFRGLQQSSAYWLILSFGGGPCWDITRQTHILTLQKRWKRAEDMSVWISSLCYGNSEAPVLSGYLLKSCTILVDQTLCCRNLLLCVCNS